MEATYPHLRGLRSDFSCRHSAQHSPLHLEAVTYQGGQLLNVDPAKGDCFLQGLLQHGQAGRAATFTKLPNINIWSVGGLSGATFANPQCVFLDQN